MDYSSPPGIRFCKDVLPATSDVLEGIRYLHLQDVKYTRQSIEAAPVAIYCWYSIMTLFVRMVTGDYECPKDDTHDLCTARVLSFHFGASAIESSKHALDATLSGHYSQAYGLFRHIVETWGHMVALRLNPAASKQWIGGQESGSTHEPRFSSAAKLIRKRSADPEDLWNLKSAEQMIKDLNQGSHPSRIIIKQLRTHRPDISQIGGHFDLEMLASSLSLGFATTCLAANETGRIFPQPMDWRSTMAELNEKFSTWQQEMGVFGP